MVSQLPVYLAFKHSRQVLEYFSAEAATRANESPWDDVKKCVVSATDKDLEKFDANDYDWNTAPLQVKLQGTENIDSTEADIPKSNKKDVPFLNNPSVKTFQIEAAKVKFQVDACKEPTQKQPDALDAMSNISDLRETVATLASKYNKLDAKIDTVSSDITAMQQMFTEILQGKQHAAVNVGISENPQAAPRPGEQS